MCNGSRWVPASPHFILVKRVVWISTHIHFQCVLNYSTTFFLLTWFGSKPWKTFFLLSTATMKCPKTNLKTYTFPMQGAKQVLHMLIALKSHFIGALPCFPVNHMLVIDISQWQNGNFGREWAEGEDISSLACFVTWQSLGRWFHRALGRWKIRKCCDYSGFTVN